MNYYLMENKINICNEWRDDLEGILLLENQIKSRIQELANMINRDYADKKVIIIGLLKGSFMFVSDLVRLLNIEYKIDFMSITSYKNSTSGSLKVNKDISFDPKDSHVLVVEDLIDSGMTMSWIMRYLNSKNPSSIRICCLLDKKECHKNSNVNVDYVGFECPNLFVVGYGMDYNEKYRCLPFVGILKKNVLV